MGMFRSELLVGFDPGDRMYILHEPLLYELNNGFVISIPAGFTTDFASIPRLFWSITPPWGWYSKAAVLHDYVYRYRIAERWVCDRVFLDAMLSLAGDSIMLAEARLFYLAVRLFGWAYY